METKIKNLFKNVIKSLFLITLLSAAKCGDDIAQLTTLAVTDVTGISAKTGGNITDEGNPPYTERGVCYGTSENPTTGSNKTVVPGSGIGEFSADLSGLSPETKYYARAYATNTEGTAYGNQIEFTTTAEATYDFPDANFRKYLLENFDSDKSGKLSESEVLKVTEIDCSDMNIASLTGIEYFRNLTDLFCGYNQLTTLDVSKCAKLTLLGCDYNQLTTLDVSKCTALTGLSCRENQLTTLDVSKCTALTLLYCDDNQLTTLDVSKCTALTELSCGGNQLTTMDVSKCTALTYLSCPYNQLKMLDVTKCTALTWLYCNSNALTTLDVSKCTALTGLYCYSNALTALDVSKCTVLWQLDCRNNPALATLKIKRGTCSYRDYSGTLITSDEKINWVD